MKKRRQHKDEPVTEPQLEAAYSSGIELSASTVEVGAKAVPGQSIAQMLWQDAGPRFRQTLKNWPGDSAKHESLMRCLSRMYQPWPDWVFRVAVEVFSVHCPRVNKRNIYGILKGIHWFFFELRLDTSEPAPPAEFTNLQDVREELIRAFGHAAAHSDAVRNQIAKLQKLAQTPEQRKKLDEMEAKLTRVDQKAMKRLLDFFEKTRAESPVAKMEKLVEAKRATFDRAGRRRDTTATPIYEKLLADWQDVESLAGASEICRFLDPVLGSGTAEAKLDRVKKICRRMGIVKPAALSRDSVGE